MSKIMLVEDDNNLREIYEARLQAVGFAIVSAKDGEEALVLAKAEKPDLIISDIMMPKISGFEMLDILRNTDGLKEVKVIMLTALGQNNDQQRADRLGADRYLVKSQVTLEDIVKAAHQLLGDDEGEAPAAPAAAAADEPAAKPEASPTDPGEATAATVVIPVATEPAVAAPDPPAAAAKDDSPVTDNTTSAAGQPEAAANSTRIEDFVAGATQEATPPPASPSFGNTAAAKPDPSPSPTTTDTAADDSANAASDDKLVSDAAQTLLDSTAAAAPQPPADPETPPTPPQEPAETAPEPKAADTPDKPEPETKAGTGSVPIAHKKVITPLDAEPKQDLDTLLAIEAANEASETALAPAAPVVSTNDSGIEAAPPAQTPAITPPAGQTVTPGGEQSAAPAVTPAAPGGNNDDGTPDPNSIAL